MWDVRYVGQNVNPKVNWCIEPLRRYGHVYLDGIEIKEIRYVLRWNISMVLKKSIRVSYLKYNENYKTTVIVKTLINEIYIQ